MNQKWPYEQLLHYWSRNLQVVLEQFRFTSPLFNQHLGVLVSAPEPHLHPKLPSVPPTHPSPQAWYRMKPVFHGTHIRGRGWLKSQESALLELPDDFKPKFKLSKVKHTSQDLCLDFSRFLPCHIPEFLCQKWRQALTNKLKKRWRSNRSSWSLIMLLCVQFKNTRESASPLRRHIRFFLVPSLILCVSLTREIIQYSFRVSRVHSTRA